MCVYRLVCMIGAVKRRVYGQVSVHAISKASSMIGDMHDMFNIPHATSCGGYNVFDASVKSVSQSVLFFLSTQLLRNSSTEFHKTL